MKNHKKYLALVTSTLLVSAISAGPAKADSPSTASLAKVPTDTSQLEAVTAANTPLTFVRSMVTTTPAPKVVEAVESPVVSQTNPVEVKPTTSIQAAPAAAQPIPKAAPVAKTAPAPVASASGKGASIVAAAYSQIGVPQDCTMLVTNSLRAVGINFHGWPADYLGLGPTVSADQAQPGDLAYYANGGSGMAHIAVYVGNGMAVHGGWNGGTTSLQSVNVGSGPVFIRVA